jgi:hypothetical protein
VYDFDIFLYLREVLSMTKISRELKHLVMLPVCALFFFIFIGAVTVQAAIYYVATTGNDSYPGTVTQPFRTIIRGLSSLQTGDNLYIREGTYAERFDTNNFNFPSGTSWTNAITLAAYPGESVTIRPGAGGPVFGFAGEVDQYIIIDGLIIDAINTTTDDAVTINQGSNHIRFTNCEIKNSYVNGVGIWWGNHNGLSSDYNEFINCRIHHIGRNGDSQVSGQNVDGPDVPPGYGRGHGFYITTSHNLIKNCVIHEAGEYGLKFYISPSTGRTSNYNIVRNSVFYKNGQNTTRYGHTCCGGLLLDSGIDNRSINNIVYNNDTIWQHGIDVGYHAVNALVYNNTIYNTGVGIGTQPTSTGTVIMNNISYQSTTSNLIDNGTGTVKRNNLTTDPMFVDAATGNFRLSSTSPAIDQGAILTEVKTDIADVPRPQGSSYDIGAYEFSANQSDVKPAPPANLSVR